MIKQLPFQVHVHLNLYAESPDQIQLALKAAYEQLALGIPKQLVIHLTKGQAFHLASPQ